MKNQPKKTNNYVFSLSFAVDQNGDIVQDVTLKEGYERTAAEILFRMSQGVIGQSLLATLNAKYPNLADLINAEIEEMAANFLLESGQKAWLNSPCVDPETVFGSVRNQSNQQN